MLIVLCLRGVPLHKDFLLAINKLEITTYLNLGKKYQVRVYKHFLQVEVVVSSLSKIFIAILANVSMTLAAENFIPYACEIGIGYDYFRSLPEGDWEGNTGGLVDLNACALVPYLTEYGIGVQGGGSYGVYDWSGRGSSPSGSQTSTQQQAFVTGAIYRQTPCCSGVNAGIAYDWMWNKNAGVFALDSSIAQLRFQGGYLYNQTDEWGVWGTLDVLTAHKESEGIPVSFRAISQINLYWEHRFANCVRTMIWAGLPYKKSLMFSSGRAGQYILGASFRSPLAYGFSIDGHASYMKGHSASGSLKQRNYAANLFIGLTWAFGDQNCGVEPYMPIGNNSNFLTDTNVTF